MTMLEETELLSFSKNFDSTREDNALNIRGQFLQAYPLENLNNMTVDEYVIGRQTASFCTYVEVKTKSWATIQGATAIKFGIYFGKTKDDSKMKYRYSQKFGVNREDAFKNVKVSLLNLIKSGQSKNFKEIDENLLSQMFKAKILSLYFPEIYLNICSAEHIKIIASELGIPEKLFISQYQHLLVEEKQSNEITKNWSNPKFMSFLYAKFIKRDLNILPSTLVQKPHKKIKRRVNFDDITANRNAIGKISEEFAIEWEKDRLIGLGYQDLIKGIKDRRDIPSYGYDYLSFSSPNCERHIEVKSVGKDKQEECFRFYLSENERLVSESDENYYFYLVFYGRDEKPCDLLVRSAKDLYSSIEPNPCAYVVRFDIEQIK